ncbi:hypothetical protein DAPPUDRAFT_107780 [Daphnia pulex]|uniref:Methyltransferase domain-containing protein n=1 Tax=Daphnia pulex TaxID=6669 RepID=E9GY76_DAPPU|nr:hypothetical protein DAPPUDRAFT_107780 [Daphnia pulex]|eukprot:EFX75553.1 hypothetical protein DAPPUDRAFT_107780 [Daphnia pulex]
MAGQKAICIDSKVAPQPGNCLIYSFGIGGEWSFDEQMERYGFQVYAFDPLMGLDQHDHSRASHFYNWGLRNRDEFNIYENWTVRSLSSIYETLSSDRLKRLSPPSKKLLISKTFHRSSSLGQQFLFFPGVTLAFSGKLLIVDDFNIHLEHASDALTLRFLELIDSFGLIQLVRESTHIKDGILDLVLCCSGDSLVLSADDIKLPQHKSVEEIFDVLGSYFQAKILNFRSGLDSIPVGDSEDIPLSLVDEKLSSFRPVSATEITSMFNSRLMVNRLRIAGSLGAWMKHGTG